MEVEGHRPRFVLLRDIVAVIADECQRPPCPNYFRAKVQLAGTTDRHDPFEAINCLVHTFNELRADKRGELFGRFRAA